MLLDQGARLTGVHLQPTSLHLEIEGKLGPPIRLADVADLRLSLGQFMLDLVSRHQHSWFASRCGQCGNSCRRPQVLVREHEILAIQMQLGLTESDFRQAYLDPADSWNAGDGWLRLTPQGACPLLVEHDPSGQPNSTHCSVHEVRPQACRDFLSQQPFCRKDPGHLLEELSSCWITPEVIVVYGKQGEQHEQPTPTEVWQELARALTQTPRPPQRRVSHVVEALIEILDEEMGSINPNYDYTPVLGRIQSLLRQATSMMPSEEDGQETLEDAWVRYRQFRDQLQAPQPQIQPQAKVQVQAGPRPWSRLRLSETELIVVGPDCTSLSARWAQPFLATLLQLPHEPLQQLLSPADPPCYMCGECCRHYVVEIHPSDITRLSQHLQMPVSEFLEKYTSPSRFGWNLRDRVLNKQPAPSYSKKLLELNLIGEQGEQQCVFLDRGQDGLFYCRVHSHKPQVCRDYAPTHKLCRQTNQRDNFGRQAVALQWVEIDSQTVQVQAPGGTLMLDRSQWIELDEQACLLEEKLLSADAVAEWSRDDRRVGDQIAGASDCSENQGHRRA